MAPQKASATSFMVSLSMALVRALLSLTISQSKTTGMVKS